jgi:hypothetical protein
LRGEVTRLRSAQNQAPTDSNMTSWAARVTLLKQKLEQMPERKIPELQFVTDKDWANAVWDADLTTDDGVRESLSKLREQAVNKFLNEMTQNALKKYVAANNDLLPNDLFALKPYYDVPVTDEMLQRYKLVQTGKPVRDKDVVILNAIADEDYDSNHGASLNGAWGGSFNHVRAAVQSAAAEFAHANGGQNPTEPAQLESYLKRSIEPVTVQKYLNEMATKPPPPAEFATIGPAVKAYLKAHNGEEPKDPSDLLPFATTPEQRAALEKLTEAYKAGTIERGE